MLIAITISTLCILLLVAMYIIFKLSQQQSAAACLPCQVLGPYTPLQSIQPTKSREDVVARDRAVLEDTLYPPTSRDTVDNTVRLMHEPRLHPNLDNTDSYSQVGYLVSRNDKEDVWKLLARVTNRSQADFYAESSNRKLDLKVPLTHEIASSADGSGGSRAFRDIYDLPDAVRINHPMFDASAVYDVVQLPRSKLASGYW